MSIDSKHRDAEDRPLRVGNRVEHYVDGDIGTVVELVPAAGGRDAHVRVRWSEDPDPGSHFGDELTILDAPQRGARDPAGEDFPFDAD